MLTLIDTFAGLGGFSYAAHAAGYNVIAQVENDPFCQKVLAHHAPLRWPNAKIYDDVRDFGRAQIPYADVITGGFPCQDISSSNPFGLGLSGKRSGLWWSLARIIDEIRPRAVLLENVPNIAVRGGLLVVEALAKMGYVGQFGVISSKDAGTSHTRARWWCVAYADGGRRHQSPSAPDLHGTSDRQPEKSNPQRAVTGAHRSSHQALREEVQGQPADQLGDHDSDRQQAPLSGRAIPQQRTHADRDNAGTRLGKSRLARGHDGLPGRLDRPLYPAGPHRPQHHWEPQRQILHRRDDWADRVHATGNAITPQIAYALLLNIRAKLEEE